jgi:transposase
LIIRKRAIPEWDFLDLVLKACKEGVLREGNFLICDNAAVHGGLATLDLLLKILDTIGAKLIFLNAYSPELNPCKLVFSIMKAHIRKCSGDSAQILDKVLEALLEVTPRHILSFYKHCIFPKVILPDLCIEQ